MKDEMGGSEGDVDDLELLFASRCFDGGGFAFFESEESFGDGCSDG